MESKFGIAKLSKPQRVAAKREGDNLEVHKWDYDTVSGLLGAPVGAAAAGAADK